jgi:hypothetical protein
MTPLIEIIDQISLGGFRHKANEDRSGAGGRHAWVIDGATGLGEPFMGVGSDAAWLAQRMNAALMRNAAIDDPTELLSVAAAELSRAFEAERTRALQEPWELPCGAFLLASAIDGGLALTWAGDCRALVRPVDGPTMAFGATALSEEAEAALVARLGKGGDAAERYRQPEALAELRAQRGAVLAAGNAMILAPDPGFLKHLSRARVAGRGFEALLMTDGFAAAELRYGLKAGPGAMLEAARVEGLAAMAVELRRFERETDPESVIKPRWKRSDDATALWLKITT